jgi:hypothetical protein
VGSNPILSALKAEAIASALFIKNVHKSLLLCTFLINKATFEKG